MYPKTMILKAGKNNPRLPICRGNNGAGPGVHLLPPVKGAIPFPGTTWRIGQEVKTPPFHGGITSSILVRVTMENKVIPRLFGGSFLFLGRIAQLVRAFASHARGRGFESPCVHQNVINRGRFLPLLISKAYYLRKKARF